MTCGVCLGPTQSIVHEFRVGEPRRPSKVWTVVAPLHYAATPDFRGVVEGFCSAVCSTAWHGRQA